MGAEVVIENVVLRGDDLNWTLSPWRSVTHANNLRLLPIAVGFLGSAFALSFMIDPSALELLSIVGPILVGFYVFLWLTNVHYLGAYKEVYATTPIGAGSCTFVFDDQGMRQTLPHGESSFRWSAFHDVVESKTGFRFWLTPFMAIMLPARYISDEQRDVLRVLIEGARGRGEVKGGS